MHRVLIPYTKPVGVWGAWGSVMSSQTGCRYAGAAFRQIANQSNPVGVRSLRQDFAPQSKTVPQKKKG